MSNRLAELICIDPAKARQLWHVAGTMIEKGYLAADEDMPADLIDRIEQGKDLLWLAVIGTQIIAAMTTRLERHPSGLVCKLVAAGGSCLPTWRKFHVLVEDYARAEGCVKMLCEGRKGWARALSGYREKRVVLEKEL